MTETTVPSHIAVDDKGVARVKGTRMKVIHLVEAWKAGASSPAQLQVSYPHLTLSQIHAALAYYYDHQAEIDARIAATLENYQRRRAEEPDSPLKKKLRDLGLRR